MEITEFLRSAITIPSGSLHAPVYLTKYEIVIVGPDGPGLGDLRSDPEVEQAYQAARSVAA